MIKKHWKKMLIITGIIILFIVLLFISCKVYNYFHKKENTIAEQIKNDTKIIAKENKEIIKENKTIISNQKNSTDLSDCNKENKDLTEQLDKTTKQLEKTDKQLKEVQEDSNKKQYIKAFRLMILAGLSYENLINNIQGKQFTYQNINGRLGIGCLIGNKVGVVGNIGFPNFSFGIDIIIIF